MRFSIFYTMKVSAVFLRKASVPNSDCMCFVIHRDIKPANLIRHNDGRLMLIDFGSVRAALDTITGGSTDAGTIGYMAPEQFMGRALPQTDVYGAAACATALLMGEDAQQLMDEDRHIDLSRIRLSSPRLELLKKFLAPRPDDRPDAAQALELLRSGIPQESTPEDFATPLPRTIPKDLIPHYLPYTQNYRLMAKMMLLIPGIMGMFYVIMNMQGLDLSRSLPFYATFGVVFGLLGLLTWTITNSRASSVLEVWRQGLKASGKIDRIDFKGVSRGGLKMFRVRYSYTVDDKVFSSTYAIFGDHNLQENTEIPVLYLPENPQKNIFIPGLPKYMRTFNTTETVLSFASVEPPESVALQSASEVVTKAE